MIKIKIIKQSYIISFNNFGEIGVISLCEALFKLT